MGNPELPQRIGQFECIRVLGQGAMGRVVMAKDPGLGRRVAIKHLRKDLIIANEQRHILLARIRQEAKACARLSHPGIVTMFEIGEDSDLGTYLVFEYVDGQTIGDLVIDRSFPIEGLSQLTMELCQALDYAHSCGVVHRDLKPDNIMISANGPKIADFGIARIPGSTLTSGGNLLGTPAYSAPECTHGGSFSAQSDQFSLAATLYELISGVRAFSGESAVDVAHAVLTEHPRALSKITAVPTELDSVFAKALSKKAENRFPNCVTFGTAVMDALGKKSSFDGISQPIIVKSVSRKKEHSLLSLFATAILAGSFGYWYATRNIPEACLSSSGSYETSALPQSAPNKASRVVD